MKKLTKVRKMTWVLWAWCLAIVVWVIAGANSTQAQVAKCVHQGVLSAQTCSNAVDAGDGIGIAVVLVIGFMGFVVLSLIWFMSRPRPSVA